MALRKELTDQDLDAGALTIQFHLLEAGVAAPSSRRLASPFTRKVISTLIPCSFPGCSSR